MFPRGTEAYGAAPLACPGPHHRELPLSDPGKTGMVKVAGEFRGTGQEYQGILWWEDKGPKLSTIGIWSITAGRGHKHLHQHVQGHLRAAQGSKLPAQAAASRAGRGELPEREDWGCTQAPLSTDLPQQGGRGAAAKNPRGTLFCTSCLCFAVQGLLH